MTISSTTRKAGPYTGNGATVAFPFAFKVFSQSDVVVTATDLSGSETTLTLTTHYTVALNADQDASPGGTVTMVTAPLTGHLRTISSAVPELQAVALTNMGGFYPAVINGALDRLTILTQQNTEQLSRAVKVAISSSTNPDSLIASVSASASAAAASANSAAASYDSFDDRYLGPKAADPTFDNDGAALLVGALYWNTASKTFKAWDGTAWATFTVNAQPLDDQLTTLAGITAQQATDLASVSGFMGGMLNDADESTARATLKTGLQSDSVQGYSASATLTAADFGRAITYTSASAGTLTLPSPTSARVGSIISIYNVDAGVCTVARSGTANIYAFGLIAVTSLSLAKGECVTLLTDGVNWAQVSANRIDFSGVYNDVVASRAFATTYTNNRDKPIAVVVSGASAGAGGINTIVTVGGVEAINRDDYASSAGYKFPVFFIVPPGASYSVAVSPASYALTAWKELY